MRNKKKLVLTSILILVTILAAESLVVNPTVSAFWQQDKEVQQRKENKKQVIVPQEQAVTNVVEDVGPAVVSVVTKQVINSEQQFFVPVPQQRKGLGSGIIIDKEGYILTNHHVVNNADKIKVLLSDGRELEAEVMGEDWRNDLAVLKVEAEDLPVAPLGDSSELKPGQLAIAIGSPYDVEFRNTVTTGVVSALNRSINIGKQPGNQRILEGLIQTDVSINPGNSGGPLLNSQGEVIAINTAIMGNAQGIGFAIPINKAKTVIDDLIKYGKVKRPWLGIYGTKLTDKLANYYNIPQSKGVLIVRTILDSPAHKSGLEKGDIIVEAGHKEVTSMKELKEIIDSKDIGDKVELLVLNNKNGSLTPVTIELGEMPSKR
ncbi:S1C family serine protease [Halanaerobacter jeridensis]|uniref:S1-C subfamily serine protease n=1 Tax=Halanaerobacter jeridensis TaxID=706427 RepID=A0A939BPP7_9FIRM|nr:trypsin-like peptidase domain-containing protein [Halanaerobacter jeridensis]MBM7557332.1 S1-C subfamily serine protease [Halanaerobacter jeridensis]